MFTSEMWSMLATSIARATLTGGPEKKCLNVVIYIIIVPIKISMTPDC